MPIETFRSMYIPADRSLPGNEPTGPKNEGIKITITVPEPVDTKIDNQETENTEGISNES